MAKAKENAKHEASPRKLKRARERGEQNPSKELGGSLALPVSLAVLLVMGGEWCTEVAGLAVDAWTGSGEGLSLRALGLLARVLGWTGLAIALAAVLCTLLQAGFHPRLRWDLSRLNPIQGMGRLFSSERLVDLAWMFVRLGAMAALAWTLREQLLAGLFGARPQNLSAWAASKAGSLVWPCLALGVFNVILGLMDWRLQRRRFRRKQRMSDEERKREHKEQEGDPGQKSERRRRHKELLQGSLADLRQAKVLVVNPTHVAAALRYVPEQDEAPVLLVAGREAMAQRMRREAVRLGLPLIQHVALARALMHCPVGESIPPELFEAAAAVLRCLDGQMLQSDRNPAACSKLPDTGVGEGSES